MTSAVAIANLALDEIPHQTITSLGDNVLAAEVVSRQLPQVLGEVMESGEWSFGVRRVTLAEITNDRTDKWRYAYATPADLAMPLAIMPGTSTPSPYVGPGQTEVSTQRYAGQVYPLDFEGEKIWSNERGAVLEYVTLTPQWTEMSRRFMRFLALMLAARIAVPIKKDYDLKQKLLQEAELFGQRALAATLNANRTEQTYGNDFAPSALTGYLDAYE